MCDDRMRVGMASLNGEVSMIMSQFGKIIFWSHSVFLDVIRETIKLVKI